MPRKRYFLVLIAIPFTFIASCTSVFAQSLGDSGSNVQYTISPQAPGPNQPTEIDVTGVGSFLGNATISWKENGTVVSSGIGDSTFTFQTGNLGSQTTVQVTITSSSVGTITQDFVIAPSLTNLVWEAHTTVPPFYRGASLYSPGSLVTVVAFPEIVVNKSFISSSALSFQWSLHGTLVPEQSGLGKNTFTFQGDQLKGSEDVSVSILLGNNVVGQGEIIIPSTAPQVLFYTRDPLRGELFDQTLFDGANISGKEVTIQAEPYYFSNDTNLTYQWTVNGEDTTGPDADRGILTLLQTTDVAGSATVGVSIQNTDPTEFLQTASSYIQILFGNTSSNSLLGL